MDDNRAINNSEMKESISVSYPQIQYNKEKESCHGANRSGSDDKEEKDNSEQENSMQKQEKDKAKDTQEGDLVERESKKVFNSTDEQNIKRHRKSKKEQNGRKYKCSQCEKSYLSAPALSSHRKTKHLQNEAKKSRGRPKKYVLYYLLLFT